MSITPLRAREDRPLDGIHNHVADLIFEVIFSAASVSAQTWTCWEVEHNAVWTELFSHHQSGTWKIIRFKVRRKLYDEIKRMDEWGNFKGARILGLCLNVLGFSGKRTRDYRREQSVLAGPVVAWTKRNYLRLVEDHPNVANACLHGSIEFDAANHQLVKTYSGNQTLKEPKRVYLKLDKLIVASAEGRSTKVVKRSPARRT